MFPIVGIQSRFTEPLYVAWQPIVPWIVQKKRTLAMSLLYEGCFCSGPIVPVTRRALANTLQNVNKVHNWTHSAGQVSRRPFQAESWNLLMQQVIVKYNVSRKVHCHETTRNQSWVYSTIVFNTVWKQGSHRTKAKRVQEDITISPSYENTTTLALPLKTPTTTTTTKITYQKHKSGSSWTSLRVYQTASLDYYSFSDSNLYARSSETNA